MAETASGALKRSLNLAQPDDVYNAIVDAHKDLSDEQCRAFDARLILLLAAGIVFIMKAEKPQERFQNMFVNGKLEDIRFKLWKPAVEIWKENIWFGAGPAHFDFRFRQYRPDEVQMRGDRVHNDYLNTLTDWGIIGLALVSSAWVLLGRGIIKTGSGILALNGANNYSGDTTISGGQVNINGTSTLGDGTGTLHLSGGKLSTSASRTASTAPVANPIDVTAESFINTSSTAANVDLNLSSATVGGAGSLIFSNACITAGGIFQPRFSAAFSTSLPIKIANGTFGSTLLQSFNTTATDQTFSGEISGTGSYKRNASSAGTGGRTIFTAANTYSGGTTVSIGTLLANNSTGSGTGSGSVTVYNEASRKFETTASL
jgi:autotransporter-associated beta strand protein